MDDRELWERFGSQRLTHPEWNHLLHVRTAFLHLARYEFDEAHLRLRAGIIRLNQVHGLEESSQRGYFETMTRAWLSVVQAARLAVGAQTSLELVRLAPHLLESSLLLRYYSAELLHSVRARSIFVGPDLAPLP
jgi:hypothetical protein